MKLTLEEKIILNLYEQHALTGWKQLPDKITGKNDIATEDYMKLQKEARIKGIDEKEMKGFKKIRKKWETKNEDVKKYTVAINYLIRNKYLKVNSNTIFYCQLLEKGVEEAKLIQTKEREIFNKWFMIALTAIIAFSTIINVIIEIIRFCTT